MHSNGIAAAAQGFRLGRLLGGILDSRTVTEAQAGVGKMKAGQGSNGKQVAREAIETTWLLDWLTAWLPQLFQGLLTNLFRE